MENIITWFEIPSIDFKRAVTFYSRVFDIEMPTEKQGSTRMAFFPHEKNVSGTIVNSAGFKPSQSGTLVYLNGGDDLNNVLDKVVDAGGKIIVGKTLISPEVGYFAKFIDSEGNLMALHSRG